MYEENESTCNCSYCFLCILRMSRGHLHEAIGNHFASLHLISFVQCILSVSGNSAGHWCSLAKPFTDLKYFFVWTHLVLEKITSELGGGEGWEGGRKHTRNEKGMIKEMFYKPKDAISSGIFKLRYVLWPLLWYNIWRIRRVMLPLRGLVANVQMCLLQLDFLASLNFSNKSLRMSITI